MINFEFHISTNQTLYSGAAIYHSLASPAYDVATQTRSEECSFVVISLQLQTTKGANAARNVVIVEQCSKIKYTTANEPGPYVSVDQCCFEEDSADVTVDERGFEVDKPEF
jgi:hypothetical protein